MSEQEGKRDTRRKRWAKQLEMLINAVVAGKSKNTTYRLHLTETEEEILRKRQEEKSKSDVEQEHEMAK
jgi:hypothetical protein